MIHNGNDDELKIIDRIELSEDPTDNHCNALTIVTSPDKLYEALSSDVAHNILYDPSYALVMDSAGKTYKIVSKTRFQHRTLVTLEGGLSYLIDDEGDIEQPEGQNLMIVRHIL